MAAGRRDGRGEACDGAEIAALGDEAYLLHAFRHCVRIDGLPRAGGYLDQRQREMANYAHYEGAYLTERASVQSRQSRYAEPQEPTEPAGDAWREELLRRAAEDAK